MTLAITVEPPGVPCRRGLAILFASKVPEGDGNHVRRYVILLDESLAFRRKYKSSTPSKIEEDRGLVIGRVLLSYDYIDHS